MKVPHQTLEVINSVLFIVHVHHCIPAELTEEFVEEGKCQVWVSRSQRLPGCFTLSLKSNIERSDTTE